MMDQTKVWVLTFSKYKKPYIKLFHAHHSWEMLEKKRERSKILLAIDMKKVDKFLGHCSSK